MLHCVPVAAAPLHCDLFNVHEGSQDHLGTKGRAATDEEVLAYVHFIRRRAELPNHGKVRLQWVQVDRRNRVCIGATFGNELSGPSYPRQWNEGAFSVVLPGYLAHRSTVTMETLDEAGEVAASSTLPVEPKKGGVIWTRDAVRTAHGPIDKPKRKRAPTSRAKVGVEVAAAPCASEFASFNDFTRAVAGTRNWFVGRWSKRTRAEHDFRFTHAEYDALKAEFEAVHGTLYPAAQEPAESASEAVPAATPAPEPENTLHGAENGENGQVEPAADPSAAILARLDALEAQLATLPSVSQAAPTSGKRERTPAHERAVRRAWAERRSRLSAEATMHVYARRLDSMTDERDAALALAAERLQRVAHESERRVENARRARRMIAAERARRSLDVGALAAASDYARKLEAERDDARERTAGVEAELARLRRDMADPSQPERASDVAQLMRERDEARTALSAVTDRAKRAEQARDELAGAVEAMGVRLANAEAAVRRLAAA